MKDLCLENMPRLKSLVLHENLRQLEKWGVQDHLPSEWLMFTTGYRMSMGGMTAVS